MQKTKIEIIDETVEYYSTHNRGLDSVLSTCVYLNDLGDMCAVGRCMIEPKTNMYSTAGALKDHDDNYLDLEKELKPEYRGHQTGFWSSLQRLHDSHGNWNPDGSLTLKGKNQVKELKEIYA